MQPRELNMYQDVLRSKRLLHQVSSIPLPFPMTVMGFLVAAALLIVMILYVDVHPFFKVFIPLGAGAFITYYEPAGINAYQYAWAQIRSWFRPSRRVGNRAVTIPDKRSFQSQQVTRIEWRKGGDVTE